MHFYYSDVFNLPLPEGHRFPGQKYRMLREKLIDEAIITPELLHRAPLAERRDIERAHAPEYVDAVLSGTLKREEERAIGLPWTEQLVTRSLATVGGQIAAVRAALDTGLSGQLAGGTHHARADAGAGFCVFNDQACAAITATAHGWVRRVAVIDLDVHQGDGTALILGDPSKYFVASMHGARNYPFQKVTSHLDIELEDGMSDQGYLDRLDQLLEAVWCFSPDLVLFQAGVDPLVDDKLGRLALSPDGLMERDRKVLRSAKERAIPVSMAIGGGYAVPIERTVAAYANTYRVAKSLYSF